MSIAFDNAIKIIYELKKEILELENEAKTQLSFLQATEDKTMWLQQLSQCEIIRGMIGANPHNPMTDLTDIMIFADRMISDEYTKLSSALLNTYIVLLKAIDPPTRRALHHIRKAKQESAADFAEIVKPAVSMRTHQKAVNTATRDHSIRKALLFFVKKDEEMLKKQHSDIDKLVHHFYDNLLKWLDRYESIDLQFLHKKEEMPDAEPVRRKLL